jgi:hypothetical protein
MPCLSIFSTDATRKKSNCSILSQFLPDDKSRISICVPLSYGFWTENPTGIPPKILSSGRYYFLVGTTAASVFWLVQWVWLAIGRSTIRGFRYRTLCLRELCERKEEGYLSPAIQSRLPSGWRRQRECSSSGGDNFLPHGALHLG